MKKNARVTMMTAVYEQGGEAATVTVTTTGATDQLFAEVLQGGNTLYSCTFPRKEGWSRAMGMAFRRAVDSGVFRKEDDDGKNTADDE